MSIRERNNNFDFLRLLAALCVIFNHAFSVYGLGEPTFLQPKELSFQTIFYGSFGVTMFFAISGYLICASLDNNNDLGTYARNRALRIYPGYIVCTLFTIIIIGSILARETPLIYLQDYMRNSFYFLLPDLTVLAKIEPLGIIDGHPVNGCVNCSLWTLPVELGCYVLAFLLFMIPDKRRRNIFWATVVMCIVLFCFPPRYVKMQATAHICTFLMGMSFYLLREKIFKLWIFIPALLFIIFMIYHSFDDVYLPYVICVSYCTLYIALNSSKASQAMGGYDYSYGMYLYHFPVMQLMGRKFGWELKHFGDYFILSFTLTFILAYFSWKLVEMPALRYKKSS